MVVLLIGLTAAAVMGRIGGSMADPTSSQAFSGVPDGPLSSDDLGRLRFDQGLRGYRMDQVDEVIDVLGARLRELEAEVASLSAADVPLSAAADVPLSAAADAPMPAARQWYAVGRDEPRE
jgi:DivIVA domain-containing protein